MPKAVVSLGCAKHTQEEAVHPALRGMLPISTRSEVIFFVNTPEIDVRKHCTVSWKPSFVPYLLQNTMMTVFSCASSFLVKCSCMGSLSSPWPPWISYFLNGEELHVLCCFIPSQITTVLLCSVYTQNQLYLIIGWVFFLRLRGTFRDNEKKKSPLPWQLCFIWCSHLKSDRSHLVSHTADQPLPGPVHAGQNSLLSHRQNPDLVSLPHTWVQTIHCALGCPSPHRPWV